MRGPDAREALLSRTFVELADSLVADFDVIEMLTLLATRSVELLDASAAGILLADPNDRLRVMASSVEQVELLELFQLQNDEGPGLDCYRSGDAIRETNLQYALNSRVVIEQAKGVLAEREQISLDEAFSVLRNQARNTRRHLTDVCAETVQSIADRHTARTDRLHP